MAKYKLPIIATSYVEVEAKNLEDAINQTYAGDPDIPGIDKSEVSEWEVDRYAAIEKDGLMIQDENGELYVSDIFDPTKY